MIVDLKLGKVLKPEYNKQATQTHKIMSNIGCYKSNNTAGISDKGYSSKSIFNNKRENIII